MSLNKTELKIESKENKYLGFIKESLAVVSSMVIVFSALAVTGPLAYGLQHVEQLF